MLRFSSSTYGTDARIAGEIWGFPTVVVSPYTLQWAAIRCLVVVPHYFLKFSHYLPPLAEFPSVI